MSKLLIALLVVGLVGCGSDDDAAPQSPTEFNTVNNLNNENNLNNDTGEPRTDMGTVEPGDMGSVEDAGSIDVGTDEPDAQNGPDMLVDQGNSAEDMSGMATDPQLAGPLGSQTSSTTISTGGESLDLEIFVPTGAGPYPVVVFHHGFQLSPSDFTSYGEHLASHGYVVVMPEMPGSAFNPTPHSELSQLLLGVVDWVEDDIVNGSLIGSRGDASRLGLAGHSLGGKVSLLSAANDSRPDAVFGIDPVDSVPPFQSEGPNYPSVTPERMSDISVPIVLLGETVDSAGSFQNCAPADQNFQQYYSASESPALEIEIVGADHMDFLDNPNCGLVCSACGPGAADAAEVRSATQGYMTAFFDVVLKGEDAQKTWLTGPEMTADENAGIVVWQSKNGF